MSLPCAFRPCCSELGFDVPCCAVCVQASVESMFGTSTRISTQQYRRYWQIWPSATSLWNAFHWGQVSAMIKCTAT